MKISARWLQQLFSFDVPVDQAAQVLTATGLEVEGVEHVQDVPGGLAGVVICLLYTSPSPRDRQKSRMPSSA